MLYSSWLERPGGVLGTNKAKDLNGKLCGYDFRFWSSEEARNMVWVRFVVAVDEVDVVDPGERLGPFVRDYQQRANCGLNSRQSSHGIM